MYVLAPQCKKIAEKKETFKNNLQNSHQAYAYIHVRVCTASSRIKKCEIPKTTRKKQKRKPKRRDNKKARTYSHELTKRIVLYYE